MRRADRRFLAIGRVAGLALLAAYAISAFH